MVGNPKQIKLAPNFTLAEFLHPGAPFPPNDVLANLTKLANRLQAVRDILGKKIKITSGWRTAAHNKAVGGAPNSQHLYGRAADIEVEGMAASEVQKFLHNWSGGLGRASNYTHLDIREGTARWTYP